MERQDQQMPWWARLVAVSVMLLVSLDLLLVGCASLGRPVFPALTRHLAAAQQAAALDGEVQRLRDRYASFRRRFDARAEAARPEHVRNRAIVREA